MATNRQNEAGLKTLTPTEMVGVQGGGRDDDGGATCWESPNKVINEDSVWFEVPCDVAGR